MTTRWISVRMDGLPIEDLFVYRTALFAWTYDSELRVFPVARIEEAIWESLADDPEAAEAACFQLFHSNGVGAKFGQRQAVQHLAERNSDLEITIDTDSIPHEVFETRLEANSLLDLLIYFDRTYLGTDEGLFELVWSESKSKTALFKNRIGHACYSVSASLGSVAASCGDAGLRVLFDDFSYLPGKRTQERSVAPVSERATFGSGGLFNFTTRQSVSYLEGEREATTSDERGVPEKVLVAVEAAEMSASTDQQRSLFLDDGLDYVLFSRQRLIALRDGRVAASRLHRDEGGRRIANTVHELGRYTGRPLSACETSSMLLIETSSGLFSASLDSDASEFRPCGVTVSLRTFPSSKRYLELAARTAEDATYLYAAIPERTSTEQMG